MGEMVTKTISNRVNRSSERATPQSGAPNSSQFQGTMADVRTCIRSCAMHVQTDIYIYTNITESRIECDYWPRYAHAARQ